MEKKPRGCSYLLKRDLDFVHIYSKETSERLLLLVYRDVCYNSRERQQPLIVPREDLSADRVSQLPLLWDSLCVPLAWLLWTSQRSLKNISNEQRKHLVRQSKQAIPKLPRKVADHFTRPVVPKAGLGTGRIDRRKR